MIDEKKLLEDINSWFYWMIEVERDRRNGELVWELFQTQVSICRIVEAQTTIEAISKDRVEAAVNVLRQIDWVGSGAKAMIETAIGILIEEKKDESNYTGEAYEVCR